jgi:hypothetical protein
MTEGRELPGNQRAFCQGSLTGPAPPVSRHQGGWRSRSASGPAFALGQAGPTSLSHARTTVHLVRIGRRLALGPQWRANWGRQPRAWVVRPRPAPASFLTLPRPHRLRSAARRWRG